MHYDYQCECGEIFDDFQPVDKRHTSRCPVCGRVANLLFRPLSLPTPLPFEPYIDTNLSPDGEPILVESRSQKRRLLRQQGLDWMPSVRWV